MSPPAIDQHLVLGPMLRYVDETSATVWVSTAGPRRRIEDERIRSEPRT